MWFFSLCLCKLVLLSEIFFSIRIEQRIHFDEFVILSGWKNEKKTKKTWINSDGDTKMTVFMILFILLHERNHQAHVASTNSWKVEETWTQENHWARTRQNEEIDKMIRDELKFDYTINFIFHQ